MDIVIRLTLFLCCVLSGNFVMAEEPVCTVKGRVYTELKWYGYLVQKPFHRDWAKIQYQITYPVKECCTNLLIYYDDQIRQLKEDMTCKEREKILPADNNQIIPLYKNNRTVGCNIWNETGEPYYVCLGERIFRSSGPRTWYFALSRCDSMQPLNLNYVFNVSGFYGDCEQDPLGKAVIPPLPAPDQFMYVSLGLGIVAGVALIAAAVFFALWFLGRRRSKSKGSSVTSSQATMTQDDVFYVNPSLSDQGQTDYSQTSSENYYEVIPERRSYESINTNNLAAMQGQSHAHALALAHHNRHLTSVKDFRPFHHQQMSLCVDDYPPPPYQPPRMLHGMPKHHTLHHPPHHHPHHGHHPHLHPQQYTIHRDRAMLANTSSQPLPTHTETSA
ncbi:hypothetical protein SNE40_007202 [Patella caerulea]|uniref:GPR180-like N-terminal domain-containing protein n=2 Tax=Patella caerulea TaxID=87958 RepID=A0AAN8PUN5_PATCE